MSHLGSVGSGSKLQRQKQGPWNLKKARVHVSGGRRRGTAWAWSRKSVGLGVKWMGERPRRERETDRQTDKEKGEKLY